MEEAEEEVERVPSLMKRLLKRERLAVEGDLPGSHCPANTLVEFVYLSWV